MTTATRIWHSAPSSAVVDHLLTRPDWMTRAACNVQPRFTELPLVQQLSYCNGCPVAGDCLDYGALETSYQPKDALTYGGVSGVAMARIQRSAQTSAA